MKKVIVMLTFLLAFLFISSIVLAQKPKSRAVFAVFEGLKINIYSANPDGINRELLLSQDVSEPSTRSRLFTEVDIKISPTKDLIVYKFPSSPVFLMDYQGQNKKKILDDNVKSFNWSRDGKKIIYSIPTPATPKFDNFPVELPFSALGAEWHIFDITNSKDTTIAKPELQFHSLGSWVDKNKIIFIRTNVYNSGLVLFNSATQKLRQINLPQGYAQVQEVSTNPSGSRTIVSILPQDYGLNRSCDFYEVQINGKLGKHLIADKIYPCESIGWNGDNEFYYGKGTAPKGDISRSETGESGYGILFSVYKYNFKTKKDELILNGNGKEVYRFQNVLKDLGVIVSNESNKRTPKYILEIRNLDGSNPKNLFTSDKEILSIN